MKLIDTCSTCKYLITDSHTEDGYDTCTEIFMNHKTDEVRDPWILVQPKEISQTFGCCKWKDKNVNN